MTLIVTTDEGYSPSLDDIIAFIQRHKHGG